MGTRIYLPSSGAPPVSPAFDGAWGQTAGADRIRAVANLASKTAMASKTTAEAEAAPLNVLSRQYVAGPLGAGEISGTLKGQIRAQEANADADYRAQLVIRVVSSDGNTVRGTLRAADSEALSSEFGTDLANRGCPLKALQPEALAAVTAQAGDWLVIEIGYRSHNAHTTSRDGTLRYGDAATSDLAEDETTTADNNPWIEFSQTIPIQEIDARQVVGEVAHTIVPEIRARQVMAEVVHTIVPEIRARQVVAEVAYLYGLVLQPPHVHGCIIPNADGRAAAIPEYGDRASWRTDVDDGATHADDWAAGDSHHPAVTLGAGSAAELTLAGQELTLAEVLTPTEHTAIGDAAPHHAAVTLGAGSDAALSLAGQELSLAEVLTPTEHTAIGDAAPHHAPMTLGADAGAVLGLTGQQIDLDTQAANTVLAGPASGVAADPTFRALQNADLPDPLAFRTAASALTIAAGAVTATQNLHTLTSETGTTDDLDTITAAADRTLLLLQATATHTITVKHGTGNISLNGAADFVLSGNKALLLYWDGAKWTDLGAGGGGGGTALTVEEQDGTPSVSDVATIRVTNGTLTDEGSGVAKLDFGSAATDADAIHDNEAGEIHAIAEKATPADDDELLIEDSADSWAKKRVKMSNVSGGGAPADATYVVEDAHADLSAEAVLGSKVITTAAYASRQAAAKAGRIFLPSDGFYLQRDNGTAWETWGPIYRMTPPPVDGWTWVNQGTATLDTTGGALYLLAPAASGDNWRILTRPAPATPYTITVAVIAHLYNVNYPAAGIGWRQSADGKLATFVIGGEEEGTLRTHKWYSPTWWSANYIAARFGAYNALCWLRIADNGTNRICSWSLDSIHWHVFHSVSRTDFLTADQVMFCAQSYTANYPCGITMYSWKES